MNTFLDLQQALTVLTLKEKQAYIERHISSLSLNQRIYVRGEYEQYRAKYMPDYYDKGKRFSNSRKGSLI